MNCFNANQTQTTFPTTFQVRHVSNTVTFTAMAVTNRFSSSPSKIGKLRVPILKSPSHLGHCTNRLRRLSNEDNFSENLLNINDSQVFAFTIYDGHGGAQCSSYITDNLSGIIEDLGHLVEDKSNVKNYLRHMPRILVDTGSVGINIERKVLKIGRNRN